MAQDPAMWSSAWGPNFRHLNAVEILPNNKVVAVGGREFNDAITSAFVTADSGANWNIAMDNVNAILQDLDFTDVSTGYSVGWAGNVWKTTNSGDSWSQIPITGNPGTRNYNGCHFFDAMTGVIVGGNESNDAIQTILRTTDGGANWSVISDNLAPWLRAVHFVDNSSGYAVGDQGTILKSTNGGTSWSALTLTGGIASRNYTDVYFFDANTGIAIGGWESNDSIATIIRTTDGGANWTPIMDNVESMLNGIYFYSATEGYIVGDDGDIYFSNDAGATWTLQSIPVNDTYGLNAVCFKNPYFGVAVGSDGKLLWYNDVDAQLAVGTLNSPVSVVNSNTVQIVGQVDDSGLAATLELEYGTTMSFGSSVPMNPNVTSGLGSIPVDVTLSGLTPDLIYYARMKMTNALGITYSDEISFYTGVSTVPNFNFEVWNQFNDQILNNWYNTGSVEPATSYNATTAVQLQGGQNDNVGAILYGIPGQTGLEGGIPFTARPDSLHFYAKYDIAFGDSALAILMLKKMGTPIAFHQWKIGGNSGGNFEYITFPIDYLSTDDPDSLILAFTSADPFSGSANAASIMTIDDVSFYGTSDNVPNNDMESWSTETRNKAASWVSADDFYNSSTNYMVERTTDAYSGDYAVKVSNLTQENNDFGRLRVGDSLNNWLPAFPVDFNHEKLYGFLKFTPDAGDTLFARVAMFEDGTQTGWGELKFKDPITNYTMFEMPISYFGMGTADSCLIEFSMFKNGGNPGNSFAIIDNLSFDAVLLPNVSVEEITANEVRVFPNPTNGPLTIQFNQIPSEIVDILVVDMNGKTLSKESLQITENEIKIDLSNIEPQLCFVLVRDGKNLHSFKTIVK